LADGDDLLAQFIVQAGAVSAPGSATVRAHEILTRMGATLSPMLDDTPSTSTETIGRYQIIGELGKGAGGRVLEAFDPELRRKVAIKVVAAPDRELLERMVAEAQVTAQLEHPSIVPIHDLGITVDGQLFIVMKRVYGKTLFQLLGALARHAASSTAISNRRTSCWAHSAKRW
jgi:serine/threonine protein kinase